MKCEFCNRPATTQVSNAENTEEYYVCDFCEEAIMLNEVRNYSGNLADLAQKYKYNDQIMQFLQHSS